MRQQGSRRPPSCGRISPRTPANTGSRLRPAVLGPGGRTDGPGAELSARTARCQARYGGPKSVFQIGGAGAVGTGSLRGMPMLHRLHDAGFHIWPYDPPRWPLVVEIYPRMFTGPVNKSDRGRTPRYIDRRSRQRRAEHRDARRRSEDAFDALFSAHRECGTTATRSALRPPRDQIDPHRRRDLEPGRMHRPTSPHAGRRPGGAA